MGYERERYVLLHSWRMARMLTIKRGQPSTHREAKSMTPNPACHRTAIGSRSIQFFRPPDARRRTQR